MSKSGKGGFLSRRYHNTPHGGPHGALRQAQDKLIIT